MSREEEPWEELPSWQSKKRVMKVPPRIHGDCFGVTVEGDIVRLWVEDDGWWYEQASFSKHWVREIISLLKQVRR